MSIICIVDRDDAICRWALPINLPEYDFCAVNSGGRAVTPVTIATNYQLHLSANEIASVSISDHLCLTILLLGIAFLVNHFMLSSQSILL